MTTAFRGTPRPPAPAPAEVGVRFVITAPRTWNGNGFGDSPAHWVALIGDVEVGRYEGHFAWVFGERDMYFDTGVNRWKQAVCREAAKGL